VRIVAATHRDLAQEVAAGRFREDLYYRLNVVGLAVPPLRSRPEDIPLLISHFLQKHNRQSFKEVDEVPRPVLDLLTGYPWPGNVRELENCVQKAVVLAPGTVFLEELVPPTVRAYRENRPRQLTAQDALDALARSLNRYADAAGADVYNLVHQAERILILYALNRERGVKLRAARALGINRVTLDRKLAEYRIAVKRGQGATETVAATVARGA
jgi:two-component system response regulator AtoC